MVPRAQERTHSRLDPFAHDVCQAEDVLAQTSVAHDQKEDGWHRQSKESQHTLPGVHFKESAYHFVGAEGIGASASDMVAMARWLVRRGAKIYYVRVINEHTTTSSG